MYELLNGTFMAISTMAVDTDLLVNRTLLIDLDRNSVKEMIYVFKKREKKGTKVIYRKRLKCLKSRRKGLLGRYKFSF